MFRQKFDTYLEKILKPKLSWPIGLVYAREDIKSHPQSTKSNISTNIAIDTLALNKRKERLGILLHT